MVLEDFVDNDDSDEDSVYSDFNDWEYKPAAIERSQTDHVGSAGDAGRRRAGTTGGVGVRSGVQGGMHHNQHLQHQHLGLGVFSEDEDLDLSDDDLRKYQWPPQTLKPPVKKILGQPQGIGGGGQGGSMFRTGFTF